MNHNERPIGWTTINESKRLVYANVDVNTADMYYRNYANKDYSKDARVGGIECCRGNHNIPCWSLGALLNLLPKQIGMYGEKYYLIVSEGAKLPWSICYADVYNEDHPILAFQKETIVEACVEMIAALKVAEKEEKAIVLWPKGNEEGGEK